MLPQSRPRIGYQTSVCTRVVQAKDLLDQARARGGAPQAREGTENGAPAANGVRQRSGQAAESSSRQSEERATPEQRELVLAPPDSLVTLLADCPATTQRQVCERQGLLVE